MVQRFSLVDVVDLVAGHRCQAPPHKLKDLRISRQTHKLSLALNCNSISFRLVSRIMPAKLKTLRAYALSDVYFLPVLFPDTALQSRASLMAKWSAHALLQYCRTGDVRLLLALQRHLCGVQDENGDTYVFSHLCLNTSAILN